MAVGQEPVVVGIGPGQGKDPSVLRHPGPAGRFHRAEDEGGPLVDSIVGIEVASGRETTPSGWWDRPCAVPRPSVARRDHAYGLPAATSEKRAHNSDTLI